METIGIESIPRDVIQAAIAKERLRQTVEVAIEEMAEQPLTPKQMEAGVAMAITGASTEGIAEELGVSPRTIQSHIVEAYARCGYSNQREFLAGIVRHFAEKNNE